MTNEIFQTNLLKPDPDYLAPDGSEIRLLANVGGGGLAHCTLPVAKTTSAVKHKSVEEIWYFIEGEGEVWRKLIDEEEVTEVRRGVSLIIPVGAHFQFRNTGRESLTFLIATIPRWPGADEAVAVEDYWKE